MTEKTVPGHQMAAEMREQPVVWRRILADQHPIEDTAKSLACHRPRFALLVARGTSDHAALYGKYLIEILLHVPVGLVSPSVLTAYGARPRLDDVLVIAVSQSGGSPDLVRTIEIARSQGAITLAATNDATSPLASRLSPPRRSCIFTSVPVPSMQSPRQSPTPLNS